MWLLLVGVGLVELEAQDEGNAYGAGPYGGVPHVPRDRPRDVDVVAESVDGRRSEFGPAQRAREAAAALAAADAEAERQARNASILERFRAAREADRVNAAIRAEAEAFVAAEQARLRKARLTEDNARAVKQLLELRALLLEDDEEAALLLLLS